MGLSCGNPTATAHLNLARWWSILGLDVFLASKMVGPEGRAIGIDMTTAMIERARANAQAGGYTNGEFYQATIDQIPPPDASVDCVISNCVVNLASTTRRLPGDCPCSQAWRASSRQRYRAQTRVAGGCCPEHGRLCWPASPGRSRSTNT